MSLRPVKENARARKLCGAVLAILCLVALATAGAGLRRGRTFARVQQHTPAAASDTTPSIRTTDARRDLQLKVEHVNGREAVAGEVIVRFRDALATPSAEAVPAEKMSAWRAKLHAVEEELDADKDEEVGLFGSRLVHSRTKTAAALVATLAARADVEYAEPNYVVRPTATPNDPQYAQQYALPKIGAPAAWDVDTNRGSAANVVGIVDTGIDYNHPDLAANVWTAPSAFSVVVGGQTINCAAGTHGFNALTNACDPLDDDAVSSHGTHVAGIVGAVGNNSVGIAGVNWNASLMGLKFINASGAGDIAHAINALTFAIQVKAAFATTGAANVRVLNNSWGPTESCATCGFSQELLNTINATNTSQMLFVASAGNGAPNGTNNDTTPYFPASYGAAPYNAPSVVAVAATDQNDNLATFSNFGATSVHVAAPGVAILSTTRNNTYTSLNGTSQAAAYASGAAALVLSRCTALDTNLLKSTLLDNADALASLNGKTQPGRLANTGRRLNVNAAIAACAAAYPQTTSTPANIADAYVSRVNPTTNFGSATELQVKLTTTGDDSHDRQAYLKFDLASLPTQITNARLRLFGNMSSASVASAPVSVQKATDTSWLEGTINWNNQPGDIPATTLATVTITGTSAQVYDFDLTNFIQTEKSAGHNTISLRLVSTQATGTDDALYTRFNSKEAASNKPQLVIATPSACTATTSNLLAWYPGDGNADDLLSGNSGALQNGATFDVGKVGQAFKLDGVNDHVTFGPTLGNFGTSDFTINFWLRTNSTRSEDVLGKRVTCGHESFFTLGLVGGPLRLELDQDVGAANYNNIITPHTVNDGNFHHIAIVRQGTTASVYIDGVLDASGATAGVTNIANSADLQIARGPCVISGARQPFTGLLDELQIFNRALSATEVQSIYTASSAGTCRANFVCTPPPANLATWFPGEGNAFDVQGGKVGTLQNGATYTGGKIGQAFSFDGVDDYLSVPGTFGNVSELTVDAWIRTRGATGDFQAIVSSTNSGEFVHLQLYDDSSGRIAVYLNSGAILLPIIGTAPAGVWRHIALSVKSGATRLYVNGVLFASDATVFSSINPTSNLRIGSGVIGSGSFGRPFKGEIDEVHILNRALTATEVQAIYNAGTAGLCHGCVSPAAGLVGWYPGDGNANDLASGNTGTLQGAQGGPTFAAGEVGQAFNFNSSSGDDVLIGNPAALRVTNGLTLDAWVYGDQTIPQGFTESVITKWTNANTAEGCYGLWLTKDNGVLKVRGRLNTSSSPTNDFVGGALQPNKWNHVAMTYDPSIPLPTANFFLYVNGVQVAGRASNPIHDSPSTKVFIGRQDDNNDPEFFTGLIDEAQIYTRPLSATEIQAIYNAGSQGNCKTFAPSNDNFADAQVIRGTAGSLTATNLLATKERSEPAHAGNAGGASIWYKWQAPASGTVTFTTAKHKLGDPQSTFDTLLAVYVGASVDTLTLVAANDDAVSSAFTSSVTFNAAAGNTYYIAVDGFNSQTGAVALSWDYVAQFTVLDTSPNNNIANAQGIAGSAGTVSGTNVNADKETVGHTREPDHANNPGGASVWYRWTAPVSGNVTFSTAGSTFDTLLAAYTLINPNDTPAIDHLLRPALMSNDDVTGGGGTLTSSITFSATAGTAYYIVVDGAGNGRADGARNGKIVLTWRSQLSISGRIVGGGAGLPGVRVRLSGKNAQGSDVAQEVLTDGAGFYTISNIPTGGTYRVTPSRPTTDFVSVNAPALPYIDFNNFSADVVNANFRATSLGTNTVTASGKVRNSSGGAIVGVTVTLSGTTNGGAPFTRTDVTGGEIGAYILPGIPAGSYTITPVSPVYTFTPAGIPFNGSSDSLGIDFTANQSLSISGQARAADNTPLGAVTITLTRAGQPDVQTQTGADGFYTLPVAAGGNYTVTAAKSGFSFNTLSPFNNVTANVKNADFTASAAGSTLVINTVAPAAGRTTGGQQITLTGTFTNLSAVMIGGVAATINSNSGSQVVVTTPAHAIGAVQIDLIPTSGTSYSKANAFAYLPTVFTDNTLVAGVTTAKAQHILELRQAIDALRAVAGLTPAPWTDPTLSPQATQLKAVHIMELRTVLEDVASRLGYGPGTYTDPSLAVGTQIKRVHIEELRQRIRTIAG